MWRKWLRRRWRLRDCDKGGIYMHAAVLRCQLPSKRILQPFPGEKIPKLKPPRESTAHTEREGASECELCSRSGTSAARVAAGKNTALIAPFLPWSRRRVLSQSWAPGSGCGMAKSYRRLLTLFPDFAAKWLLLGARKPAFCPTSNIQNAPSNL
jgi:hypothetical protein